MTNLPEHVVLSALKLTPDELAAAVLRGEIDPPFEHPAGVFMWPRRAVLAYREKHGKPAAGKTENKILKRGVLG